MTSNQRSVIYQLILQFERKQRDTSPAYNTDYFFNLKSTSYMYWGTGVDLNNSVSAL